MKRNGSTVFERSYSASIEIGNRFLGAFLTMSIILAGLKESVEQLIRSPRSSMWRNNDT
jgi:hypothetical protein